MRLGRAAHILLELLGLLELLVPVPLPLPACKSCQVIGGFVREGGRMIRLLVLVYGLLATILFCVLGIGLVTQIRI